jgi:hypothetical protein
MAGSEADEAWGPSVAQFANTPRAGSILSAMAKGFVAALALFGVLGLAPAVGAAANDHNLTAALAIVKQQCPPPYAEIATDEWMAGWTFNGDA